MAEPPTCACGCGGTPSIARQTRSAEGIRKGEYHRYCFGHARRAGCPPVLEDRGYETPCEIWQGKPSAQGYGRTSVGGRTVPAHVAVWEKANGPVPDGHEIDHLCYVRMCVRLDHLECVTRAENRRRASLRWHHG